MCSKIPTFWGERSLHWPLYCKLISSIVGSLLSLVQFLFFCSTRYNTWLREICGRLLDGFKVKAKVQSEKRELKFSFSVAVSLVKVSHVWHVCLARTYRVYSNKCRGAYLIFRATSAALIRGRRLLKNVPGKFTFSIYLFNGTLSIC